MTLDFDVIKDPRPCVAFTAFEPTQFLIGGTTTESAVAAIDLDTGEVTLNKPVSEASQAFWDAVEKLAISRSRP